MIEHIEYWRDLIDGMIQVYDRSIEYWRDLIDGMIQMKTEFLKNQVWRC